MAWRLIETTADVGEVVESAGEPEEVTVTYRDVHGHELHEGDRVYTVGDLPAEDHDEGVVQSIGDEAYSGIEIGWDSGVSTALSEGSGLAIGERPESRSAMIQALLDDEQPRVVVAG